GPGTRQQRRPVARRLPAHHRPAWPGRHAELLGNPRRGTGGARDRLPEGGAGRVTSVPDWAGDVEYHPVRIPMRMRFRRVMEREAVLVRGPAGWGEFSPFPEYPPTVTHRWLAAALEAACRPWPEPRRSRVPVNVTIPAVPAPVAHDLVTRSGCRTAKVKVAEPGQSFSEDRER